MIHNIIAEVVLRHIVGIRHSYLVMKSQWRSENCKDLHKHEIQYLYIYKSLSGLQDFGNAAHYLINQDWQGFYFGQMGVVM